MKYYIYPCSSQKDAPYLIFSSGLGGHASFWNPQLESLSMHFNIVTYDQEGCHQDSALLPAHYHMRDMANQVLHLLEHLQIHEFHMIGHALGGIIGMELAKQLQSSSITMLSLTLINAWDELDAHTQKCFDARIALLASAGAEAYVRAQALFLYPPAWISQNHSDIKNTEDIQLQNFPPKTNVFARLRALMRFQLQAEHLQALQNTAIHIVANQDDFLVPVHKSQDLFTKLAHGQLCILPSGAHASTVTESQRLNQTFIQFFHNIKALS
ncbi:pyrimidine utilization protein D [Acinetobacter pittii]|uniref:pyrimidine utilization protein D n=1 Tax=Acinetobacter pittii TaxID=48296 RepID=UPI00326111E3